MPAKAKYDLGSSHRSDAFVTFSKDHTRQLSLSMGMKPGI